MAVDDGARSDRDAASGTGFHPISACVDYRAFILPLTGLDRPAWNGFRRSLQALAETTEVRLGVLRILGWWGFLDVPAYGFPELKVSFYRDTPDETIRAYLVEIEAHVRTSRPTDDPDTAADQPAASRRRG